MKLQVGDKLPSVALQDGNPAVKVDIADLFAGKRGIIFGVPGAFTPSCSKVSCTMLLWLVFSLPELGSKGGRHLTNNQDQLDPQGCLPDDLLAFHP